MNDPRHLEDERLSALFDGALAPDEAARLRQRIASDPALAARYAALGRANDAVRAAYAHVVDEPAPERVLELLRDPAPPRPVPTEPAASVVRLERHAPHLRRITPTVPIGLAAGIALAVGIVLGVTFAPRAPSPDIAVLAAGVVEADTALHTVLESVPSGTTREIAKDLRATPRLSFATTTGEYCRRVDIAGELGASAALACRHGADWRIQVMGSRPDAAGGVYRPAAEAPSAVEAAIDSTIAGEPLAPKAEAELIANHWTHPSPSR